MLIEELVALAAERQDLSAPRFEGFAGSYFVFSAHKAHKAHKGSDLCVFTCSGRDDIALLKDESLYDLLEAAEMSDYASALETLAAANAREIEAGIEADIDGRDDEEGEEEKDDKAERGFPVASQETATNVARLDCFCVSDLEVKRFFTRCRRWVADLMPLKTVSSREEGATEARDLHSEIALGEVVRRLLEDVFTRRFLANPQAYRAYGPYWPAMKAVLQKSGTLRRFASDYAPQTKNAQADMARTYRAKSDLETLLKAERFYELETLHHPEGRTDFCLKKGNKKGNEALWSVIDADMDALAREIRLRD